MDAPEGPLKPPPLLAEVEPELPKQTAAEEEDRCNGMMAKHSGPVVTVGDTLHRIRTVIDTVHDLRTDTGYQHALKGYLQEMKMASEEPKAPAEQVETIAVQNRSPSIAVQNRWRKRLVAPSAATEKEKSPIQKLPFADEACRWAALKIALCGVGLGSGPEHLCLGPKSCCLATIVCTCRDIFLWFYFEVPHGYPCKMPITRIHPEEDHWETLHYHPRSSRIFELYSKSDFEHTPLRSFYTFPFL